MLYYSTKLQCSMQQSLSPVVVKVPVVAAPTAAAVCVPAEGAAAARAIARRCSSRAWPPVARLAERLMALCVA